MAGEYPLSMDVMAAYAKPEIVAPPVSESAARKLMRLHFELALERGVTGQRSLQDTLVSALATAGCDVAAELPTRDATGVLTVVRLREEGRDGFLQIRTAESGFDIVDEIDIEPALLSFARASIDVLERLLAVGSRPSLLSDTPSDATH
jgi:hypothetical protein